VEDMLGDWAQLGLLRRHVSATLCIQSVPSLIMDGLAVRGKWRRGCRGVVKRQSRYQTEEGSTLSAQSALGAKMCRDFM
jgi:hypothetical protein